MHSPIAFDGYSFSQNLNEAFTGLHVLDEAMYPVTETTTGYTMDSLMGDDQQYVKNVEVNFPNASGNESSTAEFLLDIANFLDNKTTAELLPMAST
jgi:hypothetical protein